jgi:hypothetical protein
MHGKNEEGKGEGKNMMKYDINIIEKVQCDKKEILENSEIYKREYLDIILKTNGNNRLLVIMMNPSIADDEISDKTINGITKYFMNGYCSANNDNNDIVNIKYISVVNLFSICCKNSKELNSYFDQISEIENGNEILKEIISNNRKVIENKIIESNYVVLGWGDSPDNFYETSYYREVLNTLDLLRKFNKTDTYVFHIKNNRQSSENKLTNRNNPVHPSNGDIISLLKVDIDDFYRIKIKEKAYTKP